MSELTLSQSVVVDAPAALLYELVADVTRIGELSPVCAAAWWDEGDGPRVGAWFTGRNVTPERTWETRSQVVVAEPGREFAFLVGAGFVRWGWAFAPSPSGGTVVTQSWEFLPAGLAMFREKYGDDAPAQIAARTAAAHEGVPATLAALKDAAERAVQQQRTSDGPR